MKSSEDPRSESGREEEVLEQWFLATEEGLEPDLVALCDGDADLVQRVEGLLNMGRAGVAGPLLGFGGAAPADAVSAEGQVGEFRLVEKIGEGGMGTVYRARQESLGRDVALKLLRRSAIVDETALLRFRREADIAAVLEHPHIVPVYGVGASDDRPFIVMRLLSGPSLAEVDLPLAPRRVAEIGSGIARALDAAHVTGVVHRDVKPANLLLDEGWPFIVDFGLARSMQDLTLTSPSAAPGTLPYMAPEQLARGGAASASAGLDPRIDVYGLGATLYEMLSGRPPFTDAEPQRLVRAILERDPDRIELSGVDRDLETILQRALEKDPSRRFATAGALADEFDRYLAGDPIETKPSGRWSRAWKKVRRHGRVSAVIAAVGVVAVGLAVALTYANWKGLRDRADRIELVRGDLDRGALESASATVNQLVRRFGDDEVLRLARSVAAARALDRLMFGVTNRTVSVNRADLVLLRDALQGAPMEPDRREVSAFADVLATFHLDGLAVARERYASLSGLDLDPGMRAAYENWLMPASEMRPDSAELPRIEATASAADLAALRGIVMEFMGFDRRTIVARLASFHASDPTNTHVAFVLATQRMLLGDHAIAVALLRGMLGDGRDRPHVRRMLANVLIRMGRDGEAAAELAKLRGHDTDITAHLRLQIESRRAVREDRVQDFLPTILAARREWPASSTLAMIEAEYRGMYTGDLDAGRALLVEAEALAVDRYSIDAVEVARLRLDTWRVPLDDREAQARIVEAWPMDRIDAIATTELRGSARALVGRSMSAVRDPAALDTLRRALGESSVDVSAALDLAVESGRSARDEGFMPRVLEGLVRLHRVAELCRRGELHVAAKEREDVLEHLRGTFANLNKSYGLGAARDVDWFLRDLAPARSLR